MYGGGGEEASLSVAVEKQIQYLRRPKQAPAKRSVGYTMRPRRTIMEVLAALFVLLYEEPTLREMFGAEYEEYCRNVRRWLPRLRAWDK